MLSTSAWKHDLSERNMLWAERTSLNGTFKESQW